MRFRTTTPSQTTFFEAASKEEATTRAQRFLNEGDEREMDLDYAAAADQWELVAKLRRMRVDERG